MLTPFGITLRKLRLDHGLRLLDLAQALGQSSAYLSAIETGKKSIPSGHVALISNVLQLTSDEQQTLQRAADQTAKEVRVDKLATDQRELVAAFARSVDTMSDEDLLFIRQRVLKSMDGDAPFEKEGWPFCFTS